MKSWDFDAVTYDGAVYCTGCLPEGLGADSDGVMPIFADSEWDFYPVCDACGCEHDYVSLTSQGLADLEQWACFDTVAECEGCDKRINQVRECALWHLSGL